MTMRERDVEGPVSRYAKSRGWFTAKWKSVNNNGVMDRIFVRDGVVLFVEFKPPGREPRPLQTWMGNQIKAKGGRVHAIDNVEDGKALLT